MKSPVDMPLRYNTGMRLSREGTWPQVPGKDHTGKDLSFPFVFHPGLLHGKRTNVG